MTLSPQQLGKLLQKVALGDEAAFAEVYQATSPKLYAVAVRILRSKEAAEEVIQDCYFRVWEKARDFNPEIAAPVTWMTAIVRNRSLGRASQARQQADSGRERDRDPRERRRAPIGDTRAGARMWRGLLRCIEGLEPERRQIVRLAYLDGMSREALAKQFDRPEGTIKTWLHRSLAQLKGCLEQ